MTRVRLFAPIVLALPLLLTLSAAKDDPLAGRVAGPPQNCIQLNLTDGYVLEEGKVIDGETRKVDVVGHRLRNA